MPEETIKIIDLQFNLKPVITNALRDLRDSYSVLIIAKTKNYLNLIRAFVDLFVNDNKMEGIYLTTNKSYEKVLDALKAEIKLDERKLFFIDCMSEKSSEPESAIATPPQDLTELNLVLGQVLKKRQNSGFFILDSLSTLFIYNDEKSIEKFTKIFVEKMSARKLKTVVITTKTKSNEAAIETVSVFFDKVIQLDTE